MPLNQVNILDYFLHVFVNSMRKSASKHVYKRKSKSPRKSASKRSPTRAKGVFRSNASRLKAKEKGVYPRICFLTSSNEYFVCGPSGRKKSCSMLRKAKASAQRKGHTAVAAKAQKLIDRRCRK